MQGGTDPNTALLLGSGSGGGGGGGSNATAGGPFSAPASTAVGAVAPRQLGFAIQTNSSVQWFKGKYQHPNTYIQVRCACCSRCC